MAAEVPLLDWDQFDPAAYLNEYYGDVGAENRALLRFLFDSYRDLPAGGRMLDFGGGPTIYPLISAVAKVDEIHFCDFLASNLKEVERWLARDAAAFDWTAFVREVLELETGPPCSDAAVARREDEIRSKVTQLLRCDASRLHSIDGPESAYDVLVTNFCAESATSDRSEWRSFFANIVSLLKPGGTLIMSALSGATSYSVGSRWFPAVDISEEDLFEVLDEEGFKRKTIEIRSVQADRPTRDYSGLIFAVATKQSESTDGR